MYLAKYIQSQFQGDGDLTFAVYMKDEPNINGLLTKPIARF